MKKFFAPAADEDVMSSSNIAKRSGDTPEQVEEARRDFVQHCKSDRQASRWFGTKDYEPIAGKLVLS